ncbi:class I SAM-dependent methyltransferase [Kordiimonas aquimaris]|uniref:class I SAM-dependent methyltransferase n=1 Tax=Kordiimonas aquimaris TaxID=707591 RepID=UPI0021D169F2|nr:hypothetical protein [Kordiimonas aquimaris]
MNHQSYNRVKTALITGAACLTMGFAAVADGHVAKIIEKLDRPEAEVARDAGRKPAEVMEFLGVKPGMTIWDHASSSGYYSALFAGVVGPEGKVYAQNSERGWERGKATLEPRYAAMPNVEAFVGQITDFDGPDASVDMLFTGLIYHHMHYNENTGDATPDASKEFYAKAMSMLKPGGTYVIIEHQAPDGTPRAQSAAWHRASLANAIADLTAAGFEYVGNSNVLANPDDPQNIHFRELTSGRDTSQRMVAKFRKPR